MEGVDIRPALCTNRLANCPRISLSSTLAPCDSSLCLSVFPQHCGIQLALQGRWLQNHEITPESILPGFKLQYVLMSKHNSYGPIGHRWRTTGSYGIGLMFKVCDQSTSNKEIKRRVKNSTGDLFGWKRCLCPYLISCKDYWSDWLKFPVLDGNKRWSTQSSAKYFGKVYFMKRDFGVVLVEELWCSNQCSLSSSNVL